MRRKPDELIASAPNQIYCWNITYLKACPLGRFYYLYMVTDIFSRRIVAARVYEAENDENAAVLFREVHETENLAPGQVTLHADNGAAMKGATLKVTVERLGILTSYSRPKVSDDNPYIESLFGTMKTRVGYPKKPFEGILEAQGGSTASCAGTTRNTGTAPSTGSRRTTVTLARSASCYDVAKQPIAKRCAVTPNDGLAIFATAHPRPR